jgi:hypothetical protein
MLRQVLSGGRRQGIARAVAQVSQALGVAAGESPGAMALMSAAELLPRGRVFSGCGAVTHSGQLSRGEHLELPHGSIISRRGDNNRPRSALDHANSPVSEEWIRPVRCAD